MEHAEPVPTWKVVARYIRRRWRVPLRVIAGLGVVLLLAAFAPGSPRRDDARNRRPQTAKVNATVESLYAKSVGPVFDGTVRTLDVRPGDRVRRGQVLFRMDTRTVEQELAQARADRSAAAAAYSAVAAQRHADLVPLEQQAAQLRRELAREEAVVRAALNAARERETAPDTTQGEPIGYESGNSHEAGFGATLTRVSAPVDTGAMESLHLQLAETYRVLEERRQAWSPSLEAAAHQVNSAHHRMRECKWLLHEAVRRSPLDGMVTGIYASAGRTVGRGEPVVRVDNPRGYRVVALVDANAKEKLAPGKILPVVSRGAVVDSTVVQIVPGEDKELFQYRVWLEPEIATAFRPGEQVNLTVPGDRVPALHE